MDIKSLIWYAQDSVYLRSIDMAILRYTNKQHDNDVNDNVWTWNYLILGFSY